MKLNKDPNQQQLARLFILAGSSTPQEAVRVAAVIAEFVSDNGWSSIEAEDRLAHAMSLVRVQAPKVVHENAVQVWRTLVGLD
ncbi:hypothetical protein NWI01_05360 [Nitrobacter winogradskyi]|uniref:Uncharacterized protein n=1 Tax=Nitrobacter winogradskyi TaxID=913 RepID=A0A4Y3W6M9_NITWI|nr:hypothetical protein NWI01_05360 [Nitrobacter winogradskyi]